MGSAFTGAAGSVVVGRSMKFSRLDKLLLACVGGPVHEALVCSMA